MLDFDPGDVPVQPAATVMLLRDAETVEVLMLQRNTRSVFVADMWVFPGGGVDAADRYVPVWSRVHGLDLAGAVARLDTSDAPAYWVATIRETFEEAGVLLAHDNDNKPVEAPFLLSDTMTRWRDRLNNGTATMSQLLDATGLTLDGSGLEYAARFITPVGPPRRYDARFFLATMPANQVVSVDNDEAVHHMWISPADALARHRSGAMVMMTPTIACLQRLTQYQSSDEAVSAARAVGATGWEDGFEY